MFKNGFWDDVKDLQFLSADLLKKVEGSKMGEKDQTKGKQPDFKSDGVAVWVNTKQSDGKKYLTIKIVGHEKMVAWKNEPRSKEELI